MRILVLGGTGFLGRQIVECAISRGHHVTLFNRGKTAPLLFANVETIIGDRELSHEALQGQTWDAAIDTNARMPAIARAAATVLRHCAGHYTFVSSISVYAALQGVDDGNSEIIETSPLSKLSRNDIDNTEARTYGARKALCEQWIHDELAGGPLLCLRPGLIVGPYDTSDRFTYWPVRMGEGGEVLCPGSGGDRVRFIDVRDLASWTIEMVEAGNTGTYNAVGPKHQLTMKDFLTSCKEVCNPQAKLVWVDEKFLEESKVSPWSDIPVWAPGLVPVSSEKSFNSGLRIRSIEDTIRDTWAWATDSKLERPLLAGLHPNRERQVLKEYQTNWCI